MAYGDIGIALLDGPDEVNNPGCYPKIIKVSDSMVAVAQVNVFGDGNIIIKTCTISAAGLMTLTGESLTIIGATASESIVFIHITGDTYLLAYEADGAGGYDGWMKTLTINSSTGAMALTGNSWEYGPASSAKEGDIIQISGTLYAIAYHESSGENPGTIKTFTVSAAGVITATGEFLTFDATRGGRPSLVHVSGSIYAIAYEGTGEVGYLKTMTINSSTGAFSGLTAAHTVVAWWNVPTIRHITGTYYIITYMDGVVKGRISTISISDDGQIISNVASWLFRDGATTMPYSIECGSGERIFVIVYKAASNISICTWQINADGTDGGIIDSITNIGGAGSGEPHIAWVANDVWAFCFTPTISFIATIDIVTPSAPIPPASALYIFRSPDFGATWYPCSGVVATARDIAFNARNEQDSFIVGSGEASVFYSEDEEVFTYEAGGSIEGACTNIATDLNTAAAFVGTTEKLYKTIDWGHTFYEMLNVPVTDVAIGGVNLVEQLEVFPTFYLIAYEGTGQDIFTLEITATGVITKSRIDQKSLLGGNNKDPIHISGNVYADVHTRSTHECRIETFSVESDGTSVSTAIDSYEIHNNGYYPRIIYVVGDIYAIVFQYSASGSSGIIRTVSIDSDGNIAGGPPSHLEGILDTETFDVTYCHMADIIHILGEVYLIVYQGPDYDGWMKTVTIDSSGNIDPIAGGTWEFDTTCGGTPSPLHISGTVYAVAYNGDGTGVDATVKTFNLGDDGVFPGVPEIDSYVFEAGYGYYMRMVHVTGNIYSIAYSGPGLDGWLKTVEISSAGVITTPFLSSLEFDTLKGEELDQILLGQDPADSKYVVAVTYKGDGNDGFLTTIKIDINGMIDNPIIDSWEFDTSQGRYPDIIPLV